MFRVWIVFALTAGLNAAAPPNIVVIVADDLGWGDLGCYGSKEIRTPHLDRLAKEGLKLTNSYAAAPVCSPTRAALMTGLYPQKSGFEWVIRYTEKQRGLDVKDSVLAKRLKAGGYATALYGKWHLGYDPKYQPNAHGFEDFFGFLAADLDYYAHVDALGDPGLYENGQRVNEEGYLTELITMRTVRFLEKQKDKPFFLAVMYNAPHWPFQPPGKPDKRTLLNYGPLTGSRDDYVKMVEKMDVGIGHILKTLDDKKLTDNTLVIFLSDNGGERLSDNGPFFHGKYTLWEGGLRVPCLVRWPGTIPAGKENSSPIITMDLTATMLAAAQQLAEKLDGLNQLPQWTGNEKPKERSLFWRLPRPNAQHGQKAARRGDWKYIQDRDSEMLFDLKNDPGERKNLAYQNPSVMTDFRAEMTRWEATLPKLP